MASIPILPFAKWMSGTNQNSVPANDNALRLQILEGLIISQAVTAQPASPAEGDAYIIAATHTGAQWAGFTPNDLAIYSGGTWYAFEPVDGVTVNVAGTMYTYSGGSWAAGGGSGTVTSVDATGGVETESGAPVTGAGTIRGSLVVNAQTGTSYAVVTGDRGKLITFNNAASVAATIAEATSTFGSGWYAHLTNKGAGTVTLTPATSTVNGAATLALATGQSAILTSDGTNYQAIAIASASGGGGLTGFTSSLATASPNATVNASQILASGGTTNQDAVFQPKGTGAILGQLPDSTAAGGNKRGASAVDLQLTRSANTQVAAGANSTISGGSQNTASSQYGFIGGGLGNIAGGTASVVVGGNGNSSGSAYTTIGGGDTNSISGGSDYGSIVGGRSNSVTAAYGMAGGYGAITRGSIGARVYASGFFSAAGDAQVRDMTSFVATTNATPAIATANGTAATASPSNQLNIPNTSAAAFRAVVVAYNSATGDAARWIAEGLLKRVSGNVSLVGTTTITMTHNDAGASTWALAVTADNTNKAVAFGVTGVAATSIKWVVRIEAVEVVG